jgi:hypothetical protein
MDRDAKMRGARPFVPLTGVPRTIVDPLAGSPVRPR